MMNDDENCNKCWIELSNNKDRKSRYCRKGCYKSMIPTFEWINSFLEWTQKNKNMKSEPRGSRSQSFFINGCMCHIHLSKYHDKNDQKYFYGVLTDAPASEDLWIPNKNFLILINDHNYEDTYILNFDEFIEMLEDIWTEDKLGAFKFTIDTHDRIRKQGKYYSLKQFKNDYESLGRF